MRILLAEDDFALGEAICVGLKQNGYNTLSKIYMKDVLSLVRI